MKDFFTIGEAAEMVGMTSETLRHYDRIGLVKPCRRDEWTGYRFYSRQEIVRLNTIEALRCMDLSLNEIKKILEYDSLGQIVAFLKQAEKSADDKIARLQYAKSKIRLARADYEKKQYDRQTDGESFTKHFPVRVILLSSTMQYPTLDNLWNYHSHFYRQIDPKLRDSFAFEDLAGIYTTQAGDSRLFAVCIRHAETENLVTLPEGNYLCADCTPEDKNKVQQRLMQTAKERYAAVPEFMVQQVVVSGILQWRYQIQIFLGG